MLCSIFSSQVWRAAGLEPKAVGTRLLVHEEEGAREAKAEAERRRAERAVKARRARAAKSQLTPKGLRERGLALFAQAEKRRAEEAEAEAEEAARASRAAAARQAEPSQSKASSLARAEGQAPPGKEEGLGRGGETPAAAQKAAVAGPSANPTSPLRRKLPDLAAAAATHASGGELSTDPSAESSGEEGGPTPPKSPPRVGSKPKSPSKAAGRPAGDPAAATPGLDDEQLAMLLHQELNAPSSRRRRGRDAPGATPQPEDLPSPKRRRGPGASSPDSPLSPVARRGRTAEAGGGGARTGPRTTPPSLWT